MPHDGAGLRSIPLVHQSMLPVHVLGAREDETLSSPNSQRLAKPTSVINSASVSEIEVDKPTLGMRYAFHFDRWARLTFEDCAASVYGELRHGQ